MKKAFEPIRLRETRKQEVLRELLEYNENGGGNSKNKYIDKEKTIKDSYICRELKPIKPKTSYVVMKSLACAAILGIIVGGIAVGLNITGKKTTNFNPLASPESLNDSEAQTSYATDKNTAESDKTSGNAPSDKNEESSDYSSPYTDYSLKEYDDDYVALMEAYQKILHRIYITGSYPYMDGTTLTAKKFPSENGLPITDNYFAIYDVDYDGIKELILRTTTILSSESSESLEKPDDTVYSLDIDIIYKYDLKTDKLTVAYEDYELPGNPEIPYFPLTESNINTGISSLILKLVNPYISSTYVPAPNTGSTDSSAGDKFKLYAKDCGNNNDAYSPYDYIISVSKDKIYDMENNLITDTDSIYNLISQKNVSVYVFVYYDTIMETYPAQINAHRICISFSDASAGENSEAETTGTEVSETVSDINH